MATANINVLYAGSLRFKIFYSFPSNCTFYKWCVTKVVHCRAFSRCAGWSEFSLGAHTNLYLLPCPVPKSDIINKGMVFCGSSSRCRRLIVVFFTDHTLLVYVLIFGFQLWFYFVYVCIF